MKSYSAMLMSSRIITDIYLQMWMLIFFLLKATQSALKCVFRVDIHRKLSDHPFSKSSGLIKYLNLYSKSVICYRLFYQTEQYFQWGIFTI